jgi:hypothetical protein
MRKILISLVFSVLPGLAQVNSILPSKPVDIREMAAPPAISGSEAATMSVEKAGPPGRTLYRWSIAAALAANVADVASSWSQQEANPVVAGGGSQFGVTSVAIKSGFVATSLVIQHIALRHRPDLYKKLAWLNFGTAGVLGGVAKYNSGLR